jgi:hypothetical protein
MITALELARITTLKPAQLSGLLKGNPVFDSAEFIGISNGGQFCYRVLGETGVAKVFITRKNNGLLGADLL